MPVKSDAKLKIEQFCESLNTCNYTLSQIDEKQYNYEFTVKKEGNSLKVQVYFGKKGVKLVIQGNTETELYNEIHNMLFDQPVLEFKKQEIDEPQEYIGTDESGKGDFFGPLVVAGVYINASTKSKLSRINVRDSKELSDIQINALAKKIKAIIGTDYNIICLEPEEYNELYTKHKNLNKLLNWAHSTVIKNLHDHTQCNDVIVDQFSKTPLSITPANKYTSLNILETPKAERFTAVAAASILARERFNSWFEQKEIEGLTLLKGASTQVEENARKVVKNHGKDILFELSKLHFKTTQKLF